MEKKRYNMTRKNQADIRLLFRSLVAIVLIYFAWKLPPLAAGDPTFPNALGWAGCGLFALAAIVFEIFALRSHRADRRAAELTAEEIEAEKAEQEREP